MGKVDRDEIRGSGGQLYDEMIATYGSDGSPPYFTPLIQRDIVTHDGGVSNRTKRTQFQYDSYGNVTRLSEIGNSGASGDERYTFFDFVPNIAFLVGAFFLVKIAVLVKGRPCSRMVMAGALMVASGGILKATWKLLYAANVADIQFFSEMQFILLAPGFFGLLIAVIYLARNQAKSLQLTAFAIAPWKLPILFVMTITSL